MEQRQHSLFSIGWSSAGSGAVSGGDGVVNFDAKSELHRVAVAVATGDPTSSDTALVNHLPLPLLFLTTLGSVSPPPISHCLSSLITLVFSVYSLNLQFRLCFFLTEFPSLYSLHLSSPILEPLNSILLDWTHCLCPLSARLPCLCPL